MDELHNYAADLERQGYRPATVRAKVTAVRLCATFAERDPRELTREDVLAWLGAVERAANSRIKYLSHLRAWCAWAGLPDITAGLRRPRTPVGVPRPVSEEGLALMLARAQGVVRAWVLLGAYCGLRSFETAKVCGDDLEQSASGAWLLRVMGKGGQTALVPVPDVVLVELRPLCAATSGRLWPTATAAAVQGAVRRLAESCGVYCTSHMLRHRYGTAAYAVSHDLLVTQQLMRHLSPATTAGYALVTGDRVAQVAASLPGANDAVGAGRPTLRLVR